MSMNQGSIANLDYRDYEGPLDSPRFRWWVIAREMCRQTFSRRIYWVLTLLSGWYYLVLMTVIFFVEQAMGGVSGLAQSASNGAAGGRGGRGPNPDQMGQFLDRLIWKHQFIHGFSCGQFYFFLIALLIGAATIANDNRANALLIYLSKPLSKTDYMVGKWVGVFIPMLTSVGLPSLIFYIWGAVSYQQHGFLSNDPFMFLKVSVAILTSSVLLTSLIVAISSLFNQSRIASASFAGVYVILRIFTVAMGIAWLDSQNPNGKIKQALISNLSYFSLDRFNVGMMKISLDTAGSPWFGAPASAPELPVPNAGVVWAVFGALTLVSMAVTWKKIRAIEVVG